MVRTPVGRRNNATEGPHASPILRESDPGGAEKRLFSEGVERRTGRTPKGWPDNRPFSQGAGRKTGCSPKGVGWRTAVLHRGLGKRRVGGRGGGRCGARDLRTLCPSGSTTNSRRGGKDGGVQVRTPRGLRPSTRGSERVHRQEDVGVVARVSLCKESSSGHLWLHGRNGQSRSWRPNGYGSISGGLRMWAEAVRLAIHMSEVPVLLGDSHVRSSRPTRTTSPPPRSATTFKPFPPPRNASRTGLWTGPRTPGPASGPAPPSSPAKGKRNK